MDIFTMKIVDIHFVRNALKTSLGSKDKLDV